MDLLYLALSLGFFALTALLVWALESIRRR